jgi:hypothetical protein
LGGLGGETIAVLVVRWDVCKWTIDLRCRASKIPSAEIKSFLFRWVVHGQEFTGRIDRPDGYRHIRQKSIFVSMSLRR